MKLDADSFKSRMKQQANREKNVIPQVSEENEQAQKKKALEAESKSIRAQDYEIIREYGHINNKKHNAALTIALDKLEEKIEKANEDKQIIENIHGKIKEPSYENIRVYKTDLKRISDIAYKYRKSQLDVISNAVSLLK
ncbi:hypothetical protein [Rummeliibacillus pycnus]|uniref:hypothetical protein n=1 Tax=Rummeliibacillus pycnus TaxID=101070 RepID=UPI003D2E7A75